MAGGQDTGLYLPAAEQGLAGVSAGTPGSCPWPYPPAETLSTPRSPSMAEGASQAHPSTHPAPGPCPLGRASSLTDLLCRDRRAVLSRRGSHRQPSG